MSEHLALDSLLTTTKSPVSFRLISSHLQVSTRTAQALLNSYVCSHPYLKTLWCVTTLSDTRNRRISLTTSPPEKCIFKTVWAIAPPNIDPLWLATDNAAALKMAAAPSTQVNSLRDGRYNRITSGKSLWKPASEHVAVVKAKPQGKVEKKKIGLLAEVKAKVKARDSKRATSRSSAFKSPSGSGNASKGSLFASRRLGSDATARIRAADKEKEKEKEEDEQYQNPVSKKTRKIIELLSDDEEESEAEIERDALEKEAAEREKAEREREELQREVEELTRQHDEEEEPQSPELRDLDDDTVEKETGEKEEKKEKRIPEKRKLNDAFGLPEVSQPRRIRREVEETVMGEDGYMHTRRVTKVYDEQMNEIVEEEQHDDHKNKEKNGDAKVRSKGCFGTPSKPVNSQNAKSSSTTKKKGKDAKTPSSTKKTPKKKVKGNIMSYFGKKP